MLSEPVCVRVSSYRECVFSCACLFVVVFVENPFMWTISISSVEHSSNEGRKTFIIYKSISHARAVDDFKLSKNR